MDLVGAIAGTGASGWAGAGQNLAGLTGGPGVTAEMRGYEKGLDLQTKLMTARKKRDEAMALEKLQGTLAANNVPPEMAAIISNVVQGGGTFSQATSGMGDIQQQSFKQRAFDEATGGGDLNLVNRMNLAIQGKPTDLTTVRGNTVINPMVTPDQQQLETTPYGAGMLTDRIQRTSNAAAAAAARNSNPSGKSEDQALKAAARQAYYDARAAGEDLKGVQIGDVEHAFRTKGGWTSPGGQENVWQPDDMDGEVDTDTPGIGTEDERVDRAIESQKPSTQASDPESVIRKNAGMVGSPADQARGTFNAPQSVTPAYTGKVGADEGAAMRATLDAFTSPLDATSPAAIPKNARQAPDGKWYIPDPARPGKYLRVDG